MKTKSIILMPFVKWVGGKRRVIEQYLKKYLPTEFNKYIEPFVGGGAMFCYLSPSTSILNDINSELMTTYNVIKNNPKELIDLLDNYQKTHSLEFYSKIRPKINIKNDIEIAARFIYLNKTCFNGIYRVNKQGLFNVPMDKTKRNVSLYNEDNIMNWSHFLNTHNIILENLNYLDILDKATKNDFVYCDPPYDYEIGVNGFDAYDKSRFNKDDQVKLANKLKELDKKGVKWMMSNHDTKLINELYKDFKIIKIKTNRMINSNPNNRINSADELIIINYDPTWNYYLETLEDKVLDLNILVDFVKINKNVEVIEASLNSLNYLLCSNIKEFKNRLNYLFDNNKKCLKSIFILLALRLENEFKFKMNNETFDINNILESKENIFLFFKESNLLDLILKRKIKNFVDYVYGIEVGLDTHTRKNRNGQGIEQKTFQQLMSLFKDNVVIEKQVKISEFEDEKLRNKKFDFLIKIHDKNILIESSFYNSQGSKVSETARAYDKLDELINKNPNIKYSFIWLADGQGMKSIKNTLKPLFKRNYIYNNKMFLEYIKDLVEKNK